MVHISTQLTPHPDVVSTTVENDETILLHLHTNHYYTLNETGGRIWQMLADGYSLREIGQKLEAQYEVAPDRARKCVVQLAQELLDERLLYACVK